MFTTMNLYISVSIFLIVGYIGYCRSDGDCSRIVSAVSHSGVIYFKKHYCCDNYEVKNNGCQGCRKGFTSKAESDCKPCPANTYGNKCAETCYCEQGERCDNVNGCVQYERRILMDTDTSLRTERILQETIFTTTRKDSTMSISTDLYQGYLSVIFTSTNTNATSTSSSWPGDMIFYIAGIGGGCIIVMIVFTTLGICWCKRHPTLKAGLPSEVNLTNQSPTVMFNDINVENEYDEINEENISEDHMQHQDARDLSSNENSIGCGTDNDGYLKPDNLFISLDALPRVCTCKFTNQTKHQTVELNNCLLLSKRYKNNIGLPDNGYLEIINDEDDDMESSSNFDN